MPYPPADAGRAAIVHAAAAHLLPFLILPLLYRFEDGKFKLI
ncbi:hypothetical protein [Paenibacillus thalictri]|nr:hypothetical protein [Paenibacillus thalictri]